MTIAAPKMSVRTHIPWYLRALFWIVVLSVSTAFAAWIYDAGRKFAGFDKDEVQQELTDLRARTAALTQENARLRADQDSSGSKLAIEQTTQRNLAAQVQTLESENTRLREDLAMFEGMMASERQEGSFTIAGARKVLLEGAEAPQTNGMGVERTALDDALRRVREVRGRLGRLLGDLH